MQNMFIVCDNLNHFVVRASLNTCAMHGYLDIYARLKEIKAAAKY